jgi:SMC interacting uncharacterized protein involved in chromosome segregation
VKKTLLGILRTQDGGFDILMDALAKEERTNGYFINKMKSRLQQKRRNQKKFEIIAHENSPHINEDGIRVVLSTAVSGIPNNTQPEAQSLKSITDQINELRKHMDPENVKSHMSLEELHRETMKGRERVYRQKIGRLKQESQEKDEEIKILSDQIEELHCAIKQLENENSRLQKEKEKLRLKRNEELMNIEADVHPPIVQNIITATNVILN